MPLIQVTIRFRSSYRAKEGVVRRIEKSHVCPTYDNVSQDCDAAVLRTRCPMIYESARPIRIGFKVNVPVGGKVQVSGWGRTEHGTSSDLLRTVRLPVISNTSCKAKYNNEIITPNIMCTYQPPRDTCQGDSGGPAVYNGKLVGIVSWGIGCAKLDNPGVYARIASPDISTFINNAIKA